MKMGHQNTAVNPFMSVPMTGCLRGMRSVLVWWHFIKPTTQTTEDTGMYDQLNSFEEALKHFGTRVEMICAMELGGKIDAETAYQNIKIELKSLKQIRKKAK